MGFRGRYQNKRDSVEPQIVETLRRHGCTVERLDKPVDLLVGFAGKNDLVEVKGPAGKPTKAQLAFFEAWTGEVFVLDSVAAAEEWCRKIRRGEG